MDAVGESRIKYDARGLAEPDAEVPNVSEIDGDSAVFDAADLTTRQINLEIRNLVYERGIKSVTVQNPGSKHSARGRHPDPLQDRLPGQPRLLRVWRDRRPRGAHHRPCRLVGVREHDVGDSRDRGQRRITHRRRPARRRPRDQGPLRRPLGHRPEGRADPDAGFGRLDDRLHDAARPPDHLRRRRPRPRRLDVRRHHLRRRKVKALGIDCVPGEWTDADTEYINRKFSIYDLGTPPEFQKFVCGKKLYNYDNLEPSERKLVL